MRIALLLLFLVLGARLCRLLLRLCLIRRLLLLLILRVVHAHARELVLDRHDGVAQEHPALRGLHDREEILRRLRTEARTVAAVTDRLRDAVGAAIHFRKHGREQCRAGGAELAVLRLVMLRAVDGKGLANVLFLLRDVILQLGRLALRQET